MADDSHLSRRTLLIAGGALAAGLRPARSAFAHEPTLTVGVLALQDPANNGHWIALDKKIFAAEGLSTNVVSGGPNSPPMLTLLSSGKVDMAKANWFSVVDAAAKGNDFVIVAASYPQNPTCLISLPKRPIRVASDIVGKRLLLQFKNYSEIIDTILKYNHLPVDYSVSPTGYGVDALLAGDGDGYFAYIINGPVILEMMGMKRDQDFLLAPLSGMHYNIPEGLFVVRRDTLVKNRQAVVGYFRAILRGMVLDTADPAHTVDLVANKYAVDSGINPAAQLLTSKGYTPLSRLPSGKGPLWFSSEQIDHMYDFARISGREGLPDRAALIDLGPLEDALQTL